MIACLDFGRILNILSRLIVQMKVKTITVTVETICNVVRGINAPILVKLNDMIIFINLLALNVLIPRRIN
ncbi:hypothetical protein BLOT_003174 [Blomia tropicalis]|nr:hypothetical protein BLOT_003174 [Blomia tropicalis]